MPLDNVLQALLPVGRQHFKQKSLNKNSTKYEFHCYSNEGHPWFPLKDVESYAITKNANWAQSRAQPYVLERQHQGICFRNCGRRLDTLNGVDGVSPSEQFDRSLRPIEAVRLQGRQHKLDWTFHLQRSFVVPVSLQ